MSEPELRDRLVDAIAHHAPDFGHRETYCKGCGVPTGKWGVEYIDHLADAVLAITEADKAEAVTPLKAFVRDLATHGIRFDLNPTLDTRDPLATDRYVGRIDMDIRKRAIQALGLAAEAGITVDAHTEEKP